MLVENSDNQLTLSGLQTINFEAYKKIPRLFRDCLVTEKIDGTNAQILVPEDPAEPLMFGSRNRWVTPGKDNFGFAQWGWEHMKALRLLGPGRHYGEWWGHGIQRGYGLTERRFSLFTTRRWRENRDLPAGLPDNVAMVPALYEGPFDEYCIRNCLGLLERQGSHAAHGFMKPEGVVIWHEGARQLFKVTLGDDGHKETSHALH